MRKTNFSVRVSRDSLREHYTHSVAPIHKFLVGGGGEIFYDVGQIFFCAVMPKTTTHRPQY